MKRLLYFAMVLFLTVPHIVTAQTTDQGKPTVTITDADLTGGNTYHWTKDNVYILDGFVYLEDGGVLNIEEGTVIKAKETPTSSDVATALVIARGAKIYAMGTSWEPIIFTTEYDEVYLKDRYTEGDGVDFETDRGLWGGVVILGKAELNVASENVVEGLPATDSRALYGGTDNADNSGIFRYVSIRYTGHTVEAGKELQGLTLGCVGNGTVVEYVESFNSNDDGFEFFGGTVNTKYLVSDFADDDAFDYDQGFRGNHQFWFAIQQVDAGDHLGEFDSGDDPNYTAAPKSYPYIYNATFVGRGASASGGDDALEYKEHAGGEFKNSIIMDFDAPGIHVDSATTYGRFVTDDEVNIENNIWWNTGLGSIDASIAPQSWVLSDLTANNNTAADPMLSISRTDDGGLNPAPPLGSPAWNATMAAYPTGMEEVDFAGAFGNDLWIKGWTALDHNGILVSEGTTDQGKPERTITDADLTGGNTFTWSKDTVYVLDGFVYLEDGGTLNIPAGTVIKALETPTSSDVATALIIARGAKIYAQGTSQEPIIFTTEYDEVFLKDRYTEGDGVDFETDRGLWGGVVILGKSTLNVASENVVEGLPATDTRALYGGSNDADNSGIFRYVSIRYTGHTVEAGKELQGLTLGCVGSGTVVEYVESFNSNDDGFEFFGGTVNTNNLVSDFADDDAFDYDQGFRGQHQFWFAIQQVDAGDHLGEFDSGDDPNYTAAPKSYPYIYNATFIGRGASATGGDDALEYKEHAGGEFKNSIIMDFDAPGIHVDSATTYSRFVTDDEVKVENNIWWNTGLSSIDASIAPQSWVLSDLTANNNVAADPKMNISRTDDGGLNPIPGIGGPAWTSNMAAMPPGMKSVSYMGAFGNDLWIKGWTALDHNGILGANAVSSIDEEVVSSTIPADYDLTQNFPNPFNPSTTIRFSLPEASNVKLTIYNVLGQQVAELINDFRAAGTYDVTWNASDLSSGVYIYRIEAGSFTVTKKMNLLK